MNFVSRILQNYKKAILSKILELVKYSKENSEEYREINFGTISNFKAQDINMKTGVPVLQCTKVLSSDGISHAFESHGDDVKQKLRGQIGIQDSDFELIPSILNDYDSVEKGLNNRQKFSAVLFKKKINKRIYHVVMIVLGNKDNRHLKFKTMYIKPE